MGGRLQHAAADPGVGDRGDLAPQAGHRAQELLQRLSHLGRGLPEPRRQRVEAVRTSDWVVMGPGSWFTSVVTHLLVPELREAIVARGDRLVVVLNLRNPTDVPVHRFVLTNELEIEVVGALGYAKSIKKGITEDLFTKALPEASQIFRAKKTDTPAAPAAPGAGCGTTAPGCSSRRPSASAPTERPSWTCSSSSPLVTTRRSPTTS